MGTVICCEVVERVLMRKSVAWVVWLYRGGGEGDLGFDIMQIESSIELLGMRACVEDSDAGGR